MRRSGLKRKHGQPPTIESLGQAIKRDDRKPLQPAEKPLKLTNPKGFENTLGIIERHDKAA